MGIEIIVLCAICALAGAVVVALARCWRTWREMRKTARAGYDGAGWREASSHAPTTKAGTAKTA